MPKANKDGWIRNRTGKVPNLPSSTLVEVRFRDRYSLGTVAPVVDYSWTLFGHGTDIMAYRVVESQEEVKPNNTQKAHRLIAIDSINNVMVIEKISTDFVYDLFEEGFDLPTTEIVNINTGEKKKLLTDLSHLTNWK